MAIQPDLNAALPYTYARTTRDSNLWAPANAQDRTVTRDRPITSRSGAAIVGSWEATDPTGASHRLAMLTNGRFLDVNDVEEAATTDFVGVTLSESEKLPVGFIVKRGIAAFEVNGPTFERKRELQYHELLRLTGRTRDGKDARYWETSDGLWVRHQDMTTVAERSEKPAFVKPGQRWVDVSVIAGTMVAYEGTNAVYATLVSVGRDRASDDLPDAHVTKRGEFAITAKYVTGLQADVNGFANRVEIHDAPWVIEMASGQSIHGAFWHNRFGIEHGDGNLQLAPADARWLFHWITPEVPAGWHGIVVPSNDAATPNPTRDSVPILPTADKPLPTIINIRK
jgi:lipoprotein-anchoring transpeptidase ErfK/SrfK